NLDVLNQFIRDNPSDPTAREKEWFEPTKRTVRSRGKKSKGSGATSSAASGRGESEGENGAGGVGVKRKSTSFSLSLLRHHETLTTDHDQSMDIQMESMSPRDIPPESSETVHSHVPSGRRSRSRSVSGCRGSHSSIASSNSSG